MLLTDKSMKYFIKSFVYWTITVAWAALAFATITVTKTMINWNTDRPNAMADLKVNFRIQNLKICQHIDVAILPQLSYYVRKNNADGL